MPPDLLEVLRWLEKADHDRQSVELLLAQAKPLTEIAAFHCQQAVEKTLKAYLVYREHEFEKTHDLRALANMCGQYDGEFLALLDDVEPLTAYAVRFRYPGPTEPIVEQVRRALRVAIRVSAFVSAKLPTR